MHYIYLNTYSIKNNTYYYVGSHSWNGIGLDKNYKGSSSVAKHYGWEPSSILILEEVSEERKFIAEREWIIKYCNLHGIADCANILAKSSDFSKQFKPHGFMLNLHANGQEAMLSQESKQKSYQTRLSSGAQKNFMAKSAACSEKARLKSVETRKDNGTFKSWAASMQSEEIKSKRRSTRSTKVYLEQFKACCHSKEARSKAAKTQMLNNSELILSTLNKGRTTEVRSKIDYKAVGRKMSQTKKLNGVTLTKRKVQLIKDGAVILTGNPTECCKFIGNKNWAISVNKKFSNGLTEVVHHGYIFKLID